MRRTLLSLSIAAAISLPVLVQANPLTDQGGDQTVSGDQTYTQVQATNGNTLNFTNGSIKVDNSANTTVNAPAVLVSGGSTINFGSTESKLGTVSFSLTQIKSNILIKEKLIRTILIGLRMSERVY